MRKIEPTIAPPRSATQPSSRDGVEFGDEGPENAAGEPLVSPIPAVFLGVQDRLAMDDPADIARPQRPQAHLRILRLAIPQRHADVAHRLDDAIAATGVDRLEQGVDLRPGGGFGAQRRLFAPRRSASAAYACDDRG